jgi:hypothetical protein
MSSLKTQPIPRKILRIQEKITVLVLYMGVKSSRFVTTDTTVRVNKVNQTVLNCFSELLRYLNG